MKRNNIMKLTIFLLFFAPFSNLLCMEEKSTRKDLVLSEMSTLLGYSQKEVKNNKNKKCEYLEKLQLLASISLAQNYLYEKVSIINETTDQLSDTLKNFYLRVGFEYTDRSCNVRQVITGSKVKFKDGNKETKIFKDIFVLTTPEAKAAYLQAQNLLKMQSVNTLDRGAKLRSNPKEMLSFNKIHTKLNSFIPNLLKSDNHELIALAKWMRFTVAHEQQMVAVGEINSLLTNMVFQSDPLAKKKPDFEELLKFGEKIKDQTHEIFPIIIKYYPAFYGLVDIGEKFLNFIKSYENGDELPSYDRYERLRSLFIDAYTLAQATQDSDNAFYRALKKELDSILQDRSCKNRLDLLKKYSHPLYRLPRCEKINRFPDALKGTRIVVKNNLDVTATDDEWTLDAVKASELKRKKTVQLAQQNKQRKKAAQKKAQQKKALYLAAKKGEKENNEQKELEIENSNKQNRSKQLPTIMYDWRVLRWYDPAFLAERNPDSRSLLYHTLPFVVNQLNKKYGVQVKQANRTHVGKIDTVYYTGGEIHYKRGERAGQRETVLFALCEDDAGIGYHVGWNAKEDSLFKEFETNEFNYQFPPLYNEPTFEKKTIIVDVNDEQCKTTYRENQFCFEIDDQKNGATIILYKPRYA